MKKLLTVFIISIFTLPGVFAEDLVEFTSEANQSPELMSVENTQGETDGEILDAEVEDELSIQSEAVLEDIQYNYYHSDTCSWCQKLDSFLKRNDGYDKLNINKVNVTRNGIPMIEAAEEHGVDPSTVGTPFVTYGPNGTGSAVKTGYYGAVELFADALGVDPNAPVEKQDPMTRLLFIIIGLLVIVGPLTYLGLKK